MPVTQYCDQRFQNQRDLYQFLSRWQQDLTPEQPTQFISLSFEIAPVDPLLVFHQLAQPHQLNCYFEKQEPSQHYTQPPQRTAIAAIGSVREYAAHSAQRFTEIKKFIQTTSKSIVQAGVGSPAIAPTFFCGFTFQPNSVIPLEGGFPSGFAFLPQWQISQMAEQTIALHHCQLQHDQSLDQQVDAIWKTLTQIQAINPRNTELLTGAALEITQSFTEESGTFQAGVQAALTAIAAQKLRKIVLAHILDITASQPFQPAHSLRKLRRLYPDCFLFSVGNRAGQSFLGASPERLVCVRDRQLITDALAGSAPRGATPKQDAQLAHALLNSDKDNREHQMVVEFITQQLTALGLSPQRSPLRLRQLSNIQHLHTPIQATIPPTTHILDVVAALHPTPAVAGLPRDRACAEIARLETFARSLYAAPIGWVNHQGEGEFVVGIRSALVQGCQARLFAGAGIVAGSDPDREWAEVQLKLQTILANLV